MIQYVEIKFNKTPMGVISWQSDSKNGSFEFYPAFIEAGIELSPLLYPSSWLRQKSPVFKFGWINNVFVPLPAFFHDVLPGSYARTLLDYALSNAKSTASSLSPVAYLSILGNRSTGLYSFEPAGYPELDASEEVDISRLGRYARSFLTDMGKELTENRFRLLLRTGLFTTGSRPEALLAINDFTGSVQSGQAKIPPGFEGWSMYLDGLPEPESPTLSTVYLQVKKAIACGLEALPCRQLHDGGLTHLIQRRPDRTGTTAVHIQSFKALTNNLSNNSCEAVFSSLRQLRVAYPEQEAFFKRIVFNRYTLNRQEPADELSFMYKNLKEWHLVPYKGLFTPKNGLTVCGKPSDQTREELLGLGKSQHIRKAAQLIDTIQDTLATFT